jgi:hypothetical protein
VWHKKNTFFSFSDLTLKIAQIAIPHGLGNATVFHNCHDGLLAYSTRSLKVARKTIFYDTSYQAYYRHPCKPIPQPLTLHQSLLVHNTHGMPWAPAG